MIQRGLREWDSGRIKDVVKEKPRTYKVELDNGSVLERNRIFLRKYQGNEFEMVENFEELIEGNLRANQALNHQTNGLACFA